MWLTGLIASVGVLALSVIASCMMSGAKYEKKRIFSLFRLMCAGVCVSAFLMFFPVHCANEGFSLLNAWRAFWLSVFNAVQLFTSSCEFEVVKGQMQTCPQWLNTWYLAWAATLFVLAPVFAIGFVLSLFKNLSAYLKYLKAYFKEAYIFSELNEKSLTLASDIHKTHPKAVIVFTDVVEDNSESTGDLIEAAKKLEAICFAKDILAVDLKKHTPQKPMYFFAIGADETENLNQSLKLIETYRHRTDTHLYIFSTKIESELLLTSVDKGAVKVRRINEVQSLINRVLYEQGNLLFDSARETADGRKKICAVVVGMGNHGTEMTKALAWFGQMDGYRLEIHAFDKDPLAEEKFVALAPELMSADYNGVDVEGEAQYQITIHPGMDVETASFAWEISRITDTTYVMVALGDDDVNVKTAVMLRMYFERMKIHPVIQAIVYNSGQKKALEGIKNYRGQAYDITLTGDLETSFTEAVIIDSELEEDALCRHLKWGEEEEFWTYQYNYRSSIASAIHMKARIGCAIPGAAKREEELTDEEREIIEVLEHRRWNAYMRAEGYVYSGSNEKSSRNDLGKMHHDLVDFSSLTEAEKRKDSRVGTN